MFWCELRFGSENDIGRNQVMTTSKKKSKDVEQPRTLKPARILISGYYGFSNLGDEAILTSMQNALLQQNSEAELTVLSVNPEVTRQSHKLRSISRTDFY